MPRQMSSDEAPQADDEGSPINVRVAARSFVGGRSLNEDAVACEEVDARWCCVLSDGAGGHSGGQIASNVAVERVLLGFRARPVSDPDDLRELILDAHDAVLSAQRRQSNPASPMHATVVVLVIDARGRQVIWGHVGDSRLYLLRRGRVLSITRDDSVVQWMVESGMLDVGAARDHPERNRLFAALGMAEEIRPQVSVPPPRIEDGDAMLLCSDGWWELLADGDIESAFVGAHTLDDWLDAMGRLIAARANPGQDNYSAVGVWLGDPAQTTLIRPAADAN